MTVVQLKRSCLRIWPHQIDRNSHFPCFRLLRFHESNCSGLPETQSHQFFFYLHTLLIFLGVNFIASARSHGKRREFYKLLLTRSENKEDVAAFSINPCIIALSINEPPIAGFSIEMSDSSDSSKRSKVPVEKAKTSPC